ncbi:hypothetical protein [Streptomyces albidoflavus]|uniref:hypothetical protein n=1 Tax=Streptomyces albidoflavus TaxID=1886 RepID=UPI0033FB03FA
MPNYDIPDVDPDPRTGLSTWIQYADGKAIGRIEETKTGYVPVRTDSLGVETWRRDERPFRYAAAEVIRTHFEQVNGHTPVRPDEGGARQNIDLSGQPSWADVDRTTLPTVERSLAGVRRLAVGWIGRLRAGAETYAPVPDVGRGGILELSQAQTRHLYAELGKHISEWDSEPRDLTAEADTILRDANHVGRNRASSGYEIETDGTAVHVYHSNRGERSSDLYPLHRYADTLRDSGYTGVKVEEQTEEHAARVVATPPAAEDF